MPVDLATLIAVEDTLGQAAWEMDALLTRASRSQEVAWHGARAAGYYAARDGRLLVGGRESQPLLLEVMAEAVGALIRTRPRPRPGDLFVTNDPASGGSSLEDLILARPAFAGDRLLCWVACATGQSGLGRAVVETPEALSHEGFVLPWTRIAEAGVFVDALLRLLDANADPATPLANEIRLAGRALGIGEEALALLIRTYGAGEVEEAWGQLRQGCRGAVRTLLSRLTPGETRRDLGAIPTTARVEDGAATVDLTGASTILRGTAPYLVAAACRAAFRQLFATEVPSAAIIGGWEDGVLSAIVPAGEASGGPAAAPRFLVAQAISDAVVGIFAPLLPHLCQAPGPTAASRLTLRGTADGRQFSVRLAIGGGAGATVWGDGLTHTLPLTDPGRVIPLEGLEEAAPIRILRFELSEGSPGPGQYRGGAGARLEFQLLHGRAQLEAFIPGRAGGSRGGFRGTGGHLSVRRIDRTPEVTDGPARVTVDLVPGDRVQVETPGGGGWGIPYRRSLMRVDEDLALGLLDAERAKNAYGVILKPGTLERDDHLTYRVRSYLHSTLTIDDIVASEDLLA